jgi:hypothetical protein
MVGWGEGGGDGLIQLTYSRLMGGAGTAYMYITALQGLLKCEFSTGFHL